MTAPTYDALRDALRGRKLPALVCDLDAFDANAADLVRRANGKPIRVASKSLRCRTLLARVLARPGFSGVLAFTPAEGAWLASHGSSDVLVAYPSVDAHGVQAAVEAVRSSHVLRLAVDDATQVPALAAAARSAGVVLEVCLDVDMSLDVAGLHFGVRRSPLHTVEQVRAVARAVAAETNLRLVGVIAYEAQLAGLPDHGLGALKGVAVRALKRRSAREVHQRRAAIVDALRADGHAITLVDGGGTGSLESSAADASLTEVAAGSGLYGPRSFDGFARFRPRPALTFALEASRRPAPDIVTCLGGGYIASGGAGPDRLPSPWLPAGGALIDAEGAGEVQTPVVFARDPGLAMGDPVFFRPVKAGETCERFDAILLLVGGRVVDEVPTYRGEGETFL